MAGGEGEGEAEGRGDLISQEALALTQLPQTLVATAQNSNSREIDEKLACPRQI